jgi:hypothetical protein
MHPAHSYTISLWLLGNITQNVSGYDIYSGNGTVCVTNGSTPYIYGTIKQGIPITTVANIATPLYFNSVGKFNINASCISTLNYKANNITSKKIVVAREVPTITFSKNLILVTPCVYSLGFALPIPTPIATVNNNIQNISYLIVNAIDGESASTVAKINPEGTQLLINSVGTFKIDASVQETTSLDFSQKSALSIPIVISPATPQIIFGPTFIKQIPYLKNYTYQIVGVTTTNTDNPALALSYSINDKYTDIATISGNTVTIISAGNFYINVSCPPTTNFNGLSGTTSVMSPIINIKKATPVFTIPPDFAKNWTFTSSTPYSLTGITSSNTDINNNQYTYKILSPFPQNVAILSTTTPQIKINNAGSFTLQVESPETNNFNKSSGHVYIIIPQLTPIITFPKKFVSAWKYGDNPYIFTAANISNTDTNTPQVITYSIIPISSPNNIPVASFSDPTNSASITINSVGTFKIQASCAASANGNYTASNSINPCVSKTISVGGEVPMITFSSSLVNSITYADNLNYTLPYPIAYVNNSVQTQSYFTYSVVEADSDDVSSVASISSNNASLTINSAGSFRIYAQVAHSTNHDYSHNENYSGIITVNKATPTFPSTLAIPSSWVYNEKYNIPYPTYPAISNTDPNLVFSYSTSDLTIATISGTVINIKGVGNFQISVTISETTNYKKATQIYPSQSTYYTSKPATTVIEFPNTFNLTAEYDTPYDFVPVNFVVGDSSKQTVTYSIV